MVNRSPGPSLSPPLCPTHSICSDDRFATKRQQPHRWQPSHTSVTTTRNERSYLLLASITPPELGLVLGKLQKDPADPVLKEEQVVSFGCGGAVALGVASRNSPAVPYRTCISERVLPARSSWQDHRGRLHT